MRYTLKDLVDFCWKYKRHKCFKRHAWDHIAGHILWAADRGKLVYVYDDKGICGVCTFSADPEKLYVHHIVAIRAGFRTLIAEAKTRFPGLPICGLRNSKLTTFPQNKL